MKIGTIVSTTIGKFKNKRCKVVTKKGTSAKKDELVLQCGEALLNYNKKFIIKFRP